MCEKLTVGAGANGHLEFIEEDYYFIGDDFEVRPRNFVRAAKNDNDGKLDWNLASIDTVEQEMKKRY